MANDYIPEPQWYVVHTYSGYENKVKVNIDKSIKNLNLENQILEVLVPMEEVEEVKNGVKKLVQRKLFPGYVILHMIMNEETWYVVRNTRGVTGFVGPESKPVPLTPEEIAPFGIKLNEDGEQVQEEKKQIVIDLEVGDTVAVISGAWEGREGVVRSINPAKGIVTIGIDIFGRETAVETSFLEIKRI